MALPIVPPKTGRLIFRQFEVTDVGLLCDLDSDAEVMRYLSRHPTSRAEIEEQTLPRILQVYERYPAFGRFAALDREEGDFLGWFSLDVDSPEMLRRPELGYRLRRDAWGKGLATEGSRALLDHAFDQPGVEAVFAQTMAVNRRSRRVMEKLGMRHTRTFYPSFNDPLPGTEHGEVEYEVTRLEWLARRRFD